MFGCASCMHQLQFAINSIAIKSIAINCIPINSIAINSMHAFSAKMLVLKAHMTHGAFGSHFRLLLSSLRVGSLGIEPPTLALQPPFQLKAPNCWHERASLRLYSTRSEAMPSFGGPPFHRFLRNGGVLWGSGCDLTNASVITCCDCQIRAPESGGSQTGMETNTQSRQDCSETYGRPPFASTHCARIALHWTERDRCAPVNCGVALSSLALTFGLRPMHSHVFLEEVVDRMHDFDMEIWPSSHRAAINWRPSELQHLLSGFTDLLAAQISKVHEQFSGMHALLIYNNKNIIFALKAK